MHDSRYLISVHHEDEPTQENYTLSTFTTADI